MYSQCLENASKVDVDQTELRRVGGAAGVLEVQCTAAENGDLNASYSETQTSKKARADAERRDIRAATGFEIVGTLLAVVVSAAAAGEGDWGAHSEGEGGSGSDESAELHFAW